MTAKDQAATQIGMPMAEFIRAFDEEGPFELIDGERQLIMPNVAIHVVIIKKLLALLLIYEQTSGKIEVFPEQTFALTDSPDWVRGSRVPDLAVYARDRWNDYLAETPAWENKPILLVPDLCVDRFPERRT
ncbi:MAG: Uma2 family endonuclease [Anaerolineae bacterium]